MLGLLHTLLCRVVVAGSPVRRHSITEAIQCYCGRLVVVEAEAAVPSAVVWSRKKASLSLLKAHRGHLSAGFFNGSTTGECEVVKKTPGKGREGHALR